MLGLDGVRVEHPLRLGVEIWPVDQSKVVAIYWEGVWSVGMT